MPDAQKRLDVGTAAGGAGGGIPFLKRISRGSGYRGMPLERMGFPKEGTGKSGKPFAEQRYSYSQPVRVTFHGGKGQFGDSFIDEVKGLNRTHALERARRNWPGARITPQGQGRRSSGNPTLARFGR